MEGTSVYRLTLLFGVLVELLSLLGKGFPMFQMMAWALVCLLALVLTWRRLDYGLYFLVVDLILGSKSGHHFSWQVATVSVSLRMGLYAVVMGVWAIRWLQGRYRDELKAYKGILKIWALLGVAVLWGVFRAFLSRNAGRDIFLDANGFLYGLLILPVLSVALKLDKKEILEVVRGALTIMVAKTFLIIYLFSHANSQFIEANLRSLYRWVRDSGVGEITVMDTGFARVFFQSHIYALLAFFVLFVPSSQESVRRHIVREKKFWMLSILAGVIIGSFSRSFWIATVCSLTGMVIFLIFRKQWKQLGTVMARSLLFFGTGLVILFAVVRFPLPIPNGINLIRLIVDRLL